MIHRIQLEPAFILHRRPFSNSSLLVELFSKNHGRLSAVARSARNPKSRYRGKLEPFSALIVDWSGRNELKTLGNIECSDIPILLEDKRLLCGFYLNELLVRLLHSHDPHPELFTLYHNTIKALVNTPCLESTLRCFEKNLLEQLGYGLSLTQELHGNQAIQDDSYYQYTEDRGFIACSSELKQVDVFEGRSLLALHKETLNDNKQLSDAKRLMRQAIRHRLGDKPLKSRELLK